MGKPERRHQGAESGDASPADTIYAYGGDDNILSGIGNDTVYAGAGHDTVNAGDGNDIVYGEGGDDRLMGHNGNDALYGGAGHDELYGGAGNDILDGGAGSDILKAEAGDDMLLYRHADGHTGGDMDIYDGGAGRDVLRVMLTSGEYSVALYKELQELRAFIAQNQNTNATAGPSFVLKHMGLSVSNIESLEVYVDGGLRTSAPTTGPKPPEARDDLFHVRKGQVFSGNLLANNGNGVDFDFNGDTLQVTAGTKATARGGSVTINANGTFSYTPLAGFVGDDSFSYTLSDGKGGTDTGLATMSVYPNAVLGNFYNNGISGTAGDDILIGGIRNDTLAGQGGNDIYVYNRGDGNDTITDTGGVDKIAFGAGINPGDVRFIRVANDLETHIGDSLIKIVGHFHTSGNNRIESAVFANGSVLDLSQNMTFTGTWANEGLDGSATSSSTLVGGRGNDTLRGYTGNDTYVYNRGDGNDTIADTGGVDKIVFGAGINPGDVRLIRVGNDLEVHVGDSLIKIGSHFHTSGNNRIESAVFANGSVLDLSQNMTFTGTSASEGMDGAETSSTFIGGRGNDTLRGRAGNDTYIYNYGDGNDTISDQGGTDRIVFGAGITPGNVRFETNYSDLLLHVGVNTIKIQGQLNPASTSKIESLVFADGSTMDMTGALTFTGTPSADSMTGTAGDDTLYGQAGNDGLSGGNGNDLLYGGLGNDTLAGENGDDTLFGGEGDDILNGDGGFDTASYALSVGPIAASLATGKATGEGNDTFRYIENLIGSAYNDTLTGDAANNRIEGGAGNDTMDGGAGTDTASYQSATAAVTVNLALTTAQNTGGAGIDTLLNFETLIGSNYNDRLTGDAGSNQIEGGAGNDIMDGGAGIDTVNYLFATAGVTVNLALTTAQNTGGAGYDTITNFESINGSAYNDVLYGNSGANTLRGGNGDDLLYGAGGVDNLYGEAGADTFLFDAATAFGAVDIVHGFSTAQGDKLKLADMLIGYNPLQSAIDKFVILTANGANTTLSVDRDGAGTAHTAKAIATLNGVTGLDVNALLENGNLLAA